MRALWVRMNSNWRTKPFPSLFKTWHLAYQAFVDAGIKHHESPGQQAQLHCQDSKTQQQLARCMARSPQSSKPKGCKWCPSLTNDQG